MKFSFELTKDISGVLPLVKKTIQANKGKLDGNEQTGFFEGNGIMGNYNVTGKTVTIVISKKPALLSDAKIKDEIMNFFDKK